MMKMTLKRRGREAKVRLRSVLVHPPLPCSPAPAVTRGRYHEFQLEMVLTFFVMW